MPNLNQDKRNEILKKVLKGIVEETSIPKHIHLAAVQSLKRQIDEYRKEVEELRADRGSERESGNAYLDRLNSAIQDAHDAIAIYQEEVSRLTGIEHLKGEDGKSVTLEEVLAAIKPHLPKPQNIDKQEIIASLIEYLPEPVPAQNVEIDTNALFDAFIEKIRAEKSIDISNIRNAQSFMFNGKRYKFEELMRGAGGTGGISAITGLIEAGTNVTITGQGTLSDPYVINAEGSSGGGQVNSVLAGTGISVDSTDPANPIVSATGTGIDNITGFIEAGDNVTFDGTGTLADPYIVNAEAGGSITPVQPTSGAINGSNTAFVFATKPVVLVNDGTSLLENVGWTWDAGTDTVTVDNPPAFELFSFAPAVAGAVSSVNGQTGDVILDYSDVGADQSGAASTAQTNAEAYTDAKIAAIDFPVDSVNGKTNAVVLTTADIADSANKRYVTDAELVVLGNTSGTNTGDQTSVSGNAGTATKLQTARTIDGQSFDGSANITVIAPGTHAATSKATPVDADEIPLADSASSFTLKKLTWANLKATLKTYFDTLYGSGTVTSVSGTASRITSTGGPTPVIDISSTFEGLLGKVASPLSQFAATTSAQLKGVISDETGSGALVFGTAPNITSPTGIVKGDVGLGNVDNTSDATKNAAAVSLTNHNLASGTNTFPNSLKDNAHGFTVFGTLATGKTKGFYVHPVAATLVGWNITVDAGTMTVKVWKIAAGTAHPTSANSINTSGVAISSGTAIQSTTMTDFTTTTVAAGDIIAYEITAVSGVTEATFELILRNT